MRSRLVQLVRGQGLVEFVCALAVAMASILHIDVSFASTPSNAIVFAASQDTGHDAADPVASERCHLCSVASFTSIATLTLREPTNSAVPAGRTSDLVAFEPPATAPPPKP